jgi:hypothetical protein
MPVDEVVATLMAFTRIAAGAYGERWNWRFEERNVRKDCEGWVKKHPPKERKRKAEPKLKSIKGGLAEVSQRSSSRR